MLRYVLSLVLLAKFAYSDPCDCIEGPWVYQPTNPDFNITYNGGCTATKDWPEQTWCYVKDNSCIHGINSTVPGETRQYKTCSPCNCRGSWDYDGMLYSGCKPDMEWGHWCYVQGSKANCDVSQDSLNTSEPLDWKTCGLCTCMNKWNYEGDMQMQCYNDTAWGSQWCYVDGYSNCNDASDSSVAGEHRKWISCPRTTTCASVKTAYKDSGCCGNPTGTYTAPMM